MPDESLFPAGRAQAVLALLHEHGRVASSDLAARFGVSEDSIRRDLRELAHQGLCRKVYGGAIRNTPTYAGFQQRIQSGGPERAALASAVCALLQEGQLIFLDAGSTNLAIAQALPEDAGLTLVTNAPQLAIAAGQRRGVRVQLIGGSFAAGTGGVVGAEALAQLQRLRMDVCVPGACAVDAGSGIWAVDAEEAALKRLAVQNSSRVIIAASAGKLGSEGNYHVATLAEIDDLVLPGGAPDSQCTAFADAGIRVHQPTH